MHVQSPRRLAWMLLVALTAAVFVRGVRGAFVYDDYYLIETNPALRQLGSWLHFLKTPLWGEVQTAEPARWVETKNRYYRPFVQLAYLAQFRAFGSNTAGYHVVSLMLHLACVLLAFAWLERRSTQPSRTGSGPGARSETSAASTQPSRTGSGPGARSGTSAASAESLRAGSGHSTPTRARMARSDAGSASRTQLYQSDAQFEHWKLFALACGAALFALHPSRPEAVAWISGQMDLWMTFWILIGLTVWDLRQTNWGALAAGLAFGLAFLSKEVAIVAPLCVAIDAALFASAVPRARSRLAILFLLVFAVAVLRFTVVAAPSPSGMGEPLHRAAIVLASLGLYVTRILWPWRPSTQIGLMNAEGQFSLPVSSLIVGCIALGAFVALAILSVRRRALRPWLADASWTALPLGPVLNIVPLGYTMLVAERFLYLPLLGVAALLVRGLVRLRVERAWLRRALVPVMTLLVLAWAGASAIHVGHFRSHESLWAHERRVHAESPFVHLYAATTLQMVGKLDEALDAARESYTRAVRESDRAEAAVTWASIRLQRARGGEMQSLQQLRAFFDALAEGDGPASMNVDGVDWLAGPSFDQRVAIIHRISFRQARAVAHLRTLDLEGAELQLRELLPRDPTLGSALTLARVLGSQSRWDEALAIVDEKSGANAGNASLQEMLSLLQHGRALESEPDPVQREALRARVLTQLGSTELARRRLAPRIRTYPGRPELRIASLLTQAADGDIEPVRRALEAGRAADTEHRAEWDAALTELSRLDPHRPAAQNRDVEALFR